MLLIYDKMREYLDVLKVREGHLTQVLCVGAVIVQQFRSFWATKPVDALF